MDELQTALQELESPDSNIRELALDKIGILKPNHAFKILTQALSDANPDVRSTAACNLGEINDERSIPVLIDLVSQDVAEAVRAEALDALEKYRAPEIHQILLAEITRVKRSRRPRQIVARQLEYYPDQRSCEALSYLILHDDDINVRIFAIDSLIKMQQLSVMGPRDLQKVWEQALNDESIYVSTIAEKALAESRKLLPIAN